MSHMLVVRLGALAAIATLAWGCGAGETVDVTPGAAGRDFPTVVTAADLTIDHPCLNRFRRTSTDDSMLLQIEWTGEYLDNPDAQITKRSIDIPDGSWTAVFQVGSNLASGVPCTDVAEVGDPVAEVEFQVDVSGHLEIHMMPSRPGGPAAATLSNIEIVHPDGSGSRIDSIELSNTQFSFFPG